MIDFLNLFVRPPGDLLYFLAVIVMTLSGAFMALGLRRRRPAHRGGQRYTLATLGTLAAWLVLLGGALYALLTRTSAAAILPPLERAVTAVSLLMIAWALLTADHDRWGRTSNVVTLLLMVLMVLGYVGTGLQWSPLAGREDFNLSMFGIAWTVVPVALALLGMILVLVYFRLIVDAPLKLVYFLLILAGSGYTLFQTAQGNLIGDYAGAMRLGVAAGMPLVATIIYRLVVNRLEAELLTERSRPAAPPPPRAVTAPRDEPPMERQSALLFKALGIVLTEATPEDIPQRIVEAALEMLKADIGALLRVQDANYADITCAVDRIMKRQISVLALNLDHQPTLANAIERQAQRGLFLDRNTAELDDLYTRFDVSQRGPVYFQPLVHEKQVVAILTVCLPYSGRELRDTEQELLKGLALISGSLLAMSYASADSRRRAEERVIQAMIEGVSPDDIADDDVIAARKEMDASLKLAQEQIANLTRQVMQLKLELDSARSRVADALDDSEDGLSASQQMLALSEEQRALREERDRLAQRLQQAEAALAGATAGTGDALAGAVVEALNREKADLLVQRDRLQAQLEDLRANDRLVMPEGIGDLLQGMSSEKARLEVERDQLAAQLTTIETQLRALGIENGPRGLAQLLSELYEQRAALQARYDALKREREVLLAERARLEESIIQARERETRLETLQNELKHLAADREALTKQRDQLRLERDEMYANEERIKVQRARLMAQAAGYQLELAEAHEAQAKLRVEVNGLSEGHSALATERDRLAAEKQALQTEYQQLLARVEGDRDRLRQVGDQGIGELTRMVEEVTVQRDRLQRELNDTLAALSSAENRLSALQAAAPPPTPLAYQPDDPELLVSMVQELRTPMTSVIGYVELLLSESAGILGEMQRKFMQRVLANVNRLAAMLEDLVRLTALDTGKFTLTREPVNVVTLLEDAITNASIQFREKGLTVHLDLDDSVPPVRADRDAIHQIIGQLLTNAYLVSPPESEIHVRARHEDNALLVSIEDRGGGVPEDEQMRVFTRKYKAENPLIQGIGDTGVGLSVAKALVEAHGGRLWLQSRADVGSIFSFSLPLGKD